MEITMQATTKLAWTLAEASEATGMSVAFFKKIIARGEIAATKAGARTLIRDEDLRAWLNRSLQVRSQGGSANERQAAA